MANIFRQAVVVNRGDVPPIFQVRTALFPSLLATTLAISPIPIGDQSLVVPELTPPARLVQNADTSRGTAKVLFADAQQPVGQKQTHTQPDRVRPVWDTSRPVPTTLMPAVVVLLPPGQGSFYPAPRWAWTNGDTSLKTPKALFGDAQAPVGAEQTYTQPDRVRPVWDTSQSSPASTIVVPMPPGQAAFVGAPRLLWQPQDVSQSVSLGNLTFVAAPIPPGQTAFVGAPRLLWQPGDMTFESPPVAIQGVAPAPPAPPVVTGPTFGGVDTRLSYRQRLLLWDEGAREKLRKRALEAWEREHFPPPEPVVEKIAEIVEQVSELPAEDYTPALRLRLELDAIDVAWEQGYADLLKIYRQERDEYRQELARQELEWQAEEQKRRLRNRNALALLTMMTLH